MIPAADDATAGAAYRYVDGDVERGKLYYYRLEDVGLDNSTVQHEIISASAQGISRLALVIAAGCLLIGALLILSNIIGRNQSNES